MKFANYSFNARNVNNLGDNMQVIALDEIYNKMGIPQEDIIYIDKNDLSTYNGEYAVLPVILPLIDYLEHGICGRFSERIVPVFLCLVLIKDTLLQEEVDYYNRYAPIGCRDERTMKTLRRYGIRCYLHGCITALLPRRTQDKNRQKSVFIVDAPETLMPFIPEDIKANAIYCTHLYSNLIDSPKAMMRERYERYRNEASLVITALMHCATPCIASGIPTIVAKSHISFRLGWLDKLVPVYEQAEFASINWNPAPAEYEEEKEKILRLTIDRIWGTFNQYSAMLDVSSFYEQRPKREYVVDAFMSIKKYIDEKMTDKTAAYEYSIWALSQMSILTFEYLSKNYPNAKLMHVYDTYRQIRFEGIMSISPEKIREHPDEIIFVTTSGATSSAMELFAKIGKKPGSYALLDLIF